MQNQTNSHTMNDQHMDSQHKQEQEIVNAMLRFLQHGDEVDRCYAIKTLAKLNVQSAIPAIIERLADEDIDVCIDAAQALGEMHAQQAINPLLELLNNEPDGEVKTIVSKSLGQIGGKKVIQVLLNIAENRPEDMDWSSNDDWDDWWDIQKEAVIALGNLRSETAIPLLMTMLNDEYSQDIQVDLLQALAKIGGKADKKLIHLLSLENYPKKLSNADKNLRRRATSALAMSSSEKTLKALGKALTDQYAEIRAEAIIALSKRSAENYLNPILLMLRDPSPEVKEAALRAINHLSQEYAQAQSLDPDQLIQLLTHHHETLQLTVMKTLSNLLKQDQLVASMEQLSASSQALLRRCLCSKNISIVASAASILGQLKDQHSLDYLIQLFESKESLPLVRQEVVRALQFFYRDRSEAREIVNNALYDQEQSVRLAAAHSLLKAAEQISPENIDFLPPMDVLLATIQGEKADWVEAEVVPTSATDLTVEPSQQANLEVIQEPLVQPEITESKSLIPDSQNPLRESMSTLDAIAMDNVESALAAPVSTPKLAEDAATTHSSPAALIDPDDEELAPYIDVMQKNKHVARKIRREKVNVSDDARYICIKLCAQNQQQEYRQSILETINRSLNDDDQRMRCEAAKAMLIMAQHQADLADINYNFGKLLTLLDSNDEEMRLACIDALAHTRNRAALTHLINQFTATNYIIVMHSLAAIKQIVHSHKNLTQQQREFFMNNDEVSDEQLLTSLKPLFTHAQHSVRMAAVELSVELDIEEMIPVYIEVALSGQAQLANKIAQLLCDYAPAAAIQSVLEKLSKAPNSGLRRYMMEMLAILYQAVANAKSNHTCLA